MHWYKDHLNKVTACAAGSVEWHRSISTLAEEINKRKRMKSQIPDITLDNVWNYSWKAFYDHAIDVVFNDADEETLESFREDHYLNVLSAEVIMEWTPDGLVASGTDIITDFGWHVDEYDEYVSVDPNDSLYWDPCHDRNKLEHLITVTRKKGYGDKLDEALNEMAEGKSHLSLPPKAVIIAIFLAMDVDVDFDNIPEEV